MLHVTGIVPLLLPVAKTLGIDALHFALMKDQQSNYLMVEQLVKGMTAKLYADRSYISHELKRWLKDQDIDLMTYHRKNMQVIKKINNK